MSKGSRGISAIAISADNKYVALADLHNDHNIYVYQINDGQLVWKEKGGPDKVYDVAFNPNNSNEFVSAGVKHIKFWYIAEKDIKKGLFMSKGEPTNFPCATYDANGNAWTGGTNGEVYKWDGRTLDSTVKVGGAIHTIRFADGKLLAGGKSQKIYEIADGSAKEVVGDVGSLVRSIDSHNGSYIIGTRDGTIQDGNGNIWMRSHSDGEVWGAAQLGDDKFATTADDNKLIFWDLSGKSAEVYKITDETRKAPRGGASSLTDLPDAQCGRAVAIHGDHLVIGCNDGTVRVRSVGNPSTDIKTFQDSQEWIEVIAFSPDGAHVAVGSHDNNIYVYGTEDWSLKSKLTAHNSYINCLDWSSDSKYIRSNCGAYELLFFDVEKGEQE